MVQATHSAHFIEAGSLKAWAAGALRPVQSLLRRGYDALLQANQRQAERDIARYVSTHGRFTDSLERDISNILLGDGSNRRR